MIIVVSVLVERRTRQPPSGPGHEHLVVTHVRVVGDKEEARWKPPRFQKLSSIGILPRERVVCRSRVLNGDHAKTQARIASRLHVQRVETLAGVVSDGVHRVARGALLDPDEEAVDGEDAALQALLVCGVELVRYGLELGGVVPREMNGVRVRGIDGPDCPFAGDVEEEATPCISMMS